MSCSKYDGAIKNNTHVIVDKEVNFKNFVYVFKKIIFLFRSYQNTLKNYQDDLFVLSTKGKKVFKVVNDYEVEVIAGSENISAELDGVLAKETSLGYPVSIDFDILNRLYIADNLLGSVRVVTPDGIISTLNDKNNRIYNTGQLRINNYKIEKQKFDQNLSEKKFKYNNQLISKLNPIISNYVEKNSLSIKV